jgi:hypothetical protein
MPLFHPNKCYRRKPDLVGKDGQLFNNDASLTNAIEHEGFPDGRRVGRVRIWTGDELNAWWDSRPSEPMTLPKGFGGLQPRAGRRKNPQPTAQP